MQSKVYPKGMHTPPEPETVPGAMDIDALLLRTGLILQREVKNLTIASASGKLLPAHAKDLVAYIKLLSELKAEQENQAAAMTDDELKAAATKE